MNVEESCFERTYHKVQVPSELIHPIKFRLKSVSLYLLIFATCFFLFICFFNFIVDSGLHKEAVLASFFLLIAISVGFIINEIYDRKIISLMRNGCITQGKVVSSETDLEYLDSYNIKYEYHDVNGNCFYKKSLTKNVDLKVVDILYSNENPKKAFILNNNFRNYRIDIDEIIELVKKHSTLIENKTSTTT